MFDIRNCLYYSELYKIVYCSNSSIFPDELVSDVFSVRSSNSKPFIHDTSLALPTRRFRLKRLLARNLFVLLIAVLAATSSCATKTLWRTTSAGYFVRVRGDLVTEQELQKKGLKYFKDDKSRDFYVEKTGLDRVRDYAIRVFGTPITIVIDAATTLLVIGVIGGAGFVDDMNQKEADKCEVDPVCREHKQSGTYDRAPASQK